MLWEGRCRSVFAVPLSGAMVAGGIGSGLAGQPVLGALVAAGGLAVLALVEIRVEVTADALRCRFAGSVGRPSVTIPLVDVLRAEVIDVRPLRYGGWGYRGSLRLFRRAAVTLRAGPGIRLELTGGRRFVVTVDDPEGAVAAIASVRPLVSQPT